jgi:hypothetical protein
MHFGHILKIFSSSEIIIVFVKSEDLCGTVVSDETSRLLLSLERAVVAPDKKLASKLPTSELKLVEASGARRDSSRQVGRSAGRQVGRSAVSINLAPQGPARRFGRELLGGDACFGPPRASNIPNGLTAETSAQLPWLGKLSHRWMVVF